MAFGPLVPTCEELLYYDYSRDLPLKGKSSLEDLYPRVKLSNFLKGSTLGFAGLLVEDPSSNGESKFPLPTFSKVCRAPSSDDLR